MKQYNFFQKFHKNFRGICRKTLQKIRFANKRGTNVLPSLNVKSTYLHEQRLRSKAVKTTKGSKRKHPQFLHWYKMTKFSLTQLTKLTYWLKYSQIIPICWLTFNHCLSCGELVALCLQVLQISGGEARWWSPRLENMCFSIVTSFIPPTLH